MPLSLSMKMSAGLPRDAFEVTMRKYKFIPRSEFKPLRLMNNTVVILKGRGFRDLGLYSS